MEVLISEQVRDVRGIFRSILKQLAHQEHPTSDIDRTAWESQFERFQMWVANTGAHHDGPSSLKYRLRDASQVKQKIVDLLTNLVSDLKDLQECLDESTEDTAGSDAGSGSDRETAEAEIPHIYISLSSNIDNLLRLSMLIRRKPAQYDRVKDTQRRQTSHFLAWDVLHVRNKFPNISQELAERLGQANTTRRGIQLYRENHKRKLRHGLDDDAGSVAPSSTQASDMLSDEPNVGKTEVEKDAISDTSFAPSLVQGKGSIAIPQPPQGVLGAGPFECPYCCLLIEADSTVEWAHHVFQDIQPYQCVVATCTTPHRLYESRSAWFHHLANDHKMFTSPPVTCPLCDEQMTTELLVRRHLSRHLQELALFTLPASDTEGQAEVDEELSVSEEQEEKREVTQSGDPTSELTLEVPEEDPLPGLRLQISDDSTDPRGVEITFDNNQSFDEIYNKVPPRTTEIKQPRGILKPPRQKPFPEDPNPIREGVATLREKNDIPPNARWTKISRSLVNPEALIQMRERFEEREEYVIVLRVLNTAEIEQLANLTSEIRARRKNDRVGLKLLELERQQKLEPKSHEYGKGGLSAGDSSEVFEGRDTKAVDSVVGGQSARTRTDIGPSQQSYTYTGPREQFDRDYPAAQRQDQRTKLVETPSIQITGSRPRRREYRVTNEARRLLEPNRQPNIGGRSRSASDTEPSGATWQDRVSFVREAEVSQNTRPDGSDASEAVPDRQPTRYAMIPSSRVRDLRPNKESNEDAKAHSRPRDMIGVNAPRRRHEVYIQDSHPTVHQTSAEEGTAGT